jgi:hypothetical protein
MSNGRVILVWLISCAAHPLEAGVGSKAVQETVEWMTRKFGQEVAAEGVERLSTRMTHLAAKHGDELVSQAFRRVGPQAGAIAAEAGEQANVALRLLAQYGDDAVRVASQPSARQLVAHYGDDAATALVRHGVVGESVIDEFAEQGAKALAQVTPQYGRRLAMLAQEGSLSPPLLEVIAQYGDRACQFVWSHKGSLVVGAVLATFVSNPEPYLDGTVHLMEAVAEQVVAPLAEIPQAIAVEAARGVNWTLIIGGFWLLSAGGIAVVMVQSPATIRTGKAVIQTVKTWWSSRHP